ncbi:DUF4317 domain-containing protein [Eubacterium xylanophilum]|uniref:DUF4317 domain-containing protein n=1 Tax=Eubacterium xylanophilum TaxID=39497 RepID=UPI00047B03B2|nr:DUF4317 domain-containing protein [Eubacterium xylanophilum]
MNKKEIAEIRKEFNKNDNGITRITGCYVDFEKNKRLDFKEAFYSLPDEEMHKYVDIMKKTLSGTLGKNLLNMEFPTEEETSEDGSQKFLYELVQSKLCDDALLDKLYDKIIETYNYDGEYLIILIHDTYDIPTITSDGVENFDASEYVYDFILCSICPVKLSKAALYYNRQKNSIEEHMRDWIVQAPANGFLYPAFNDRNMDIHNILYYTKNSDETDIEFSENMLRCTLPIPAKEQKEVFSTIVEESLGRDCEFEIVRNIHDNLAEMIAEKADEPEPVELDKEDMKKLLINSGATEESVEKFAETFESSVAEGQSFVASNITNQRKFELKTPDVTINVSPERTDLVDTRIIDGKPCIVIECNDNVIVNGIRVANPAE